MIDGFFEESIVKRAKEKGRVQIQIINLRDFAKDKYKTVDDKSYGGGAGMVLMVKPIIAAIRSIKPKITLSKQIPSSRSRGLKSKIVLSSPRGGVYDQKKALEYSRLDRLIIIAGHYEGVDERIKTYINEEISIGDFVMTGGEIAAAAIVDSVVRLIPGVLKREEATSQESFFTASLDTLISLVGKDKPLINLKKKGASSVQLLEYPHYTRPEKYKGEKVPEILLSGHHERIEKWRLSEAYRITKERRPDLLA